MQDLIVSVMSPMVRTVTTSKGNTMLIQRMALERDNDYPVVFEQVVDEPLAAGKYRLDLKFDTDNFKSLVLDRYGLTFTPLASKS